MNRGWKLAPPARIFVGRLPELNALAAALTRMMVAMMLGGVRRLEPGFLFGSAVCVGI